MENNPPDPSELKERIVQLEHWVQAVRRKMESLIVENRRMKEIVRLAEEELRKRRDQVHRLKEENFRLRQAQAEAKAKVAHVVQKIDNVLDAEGKET